MLALDFSFDLPSSPSADEVNATLRKFAATQCSIDFVVGEWLIAAEELEVWRRFGCANYCEYVGRIFGWNWRQAMQRLDTAKRLRKLPRLGDALRDARHAWSAVREVARVATPETESSWLRCIEGKTLRQIEPMVSGLEEGALPGEKKDPRKVVKRVVLELTQEKYDRYAAGVGVMRKDCDEFLSEEDIVLAALEEKVAERTGDGSRSRNQLLFVRTLDTGETYMASEEGFSTVSEEVAELLDCDSVQIGLPGQDAAGGRAKQTVPPSVRRLCIARAGGRCQVPGCRQIHNLEVHHRKLRKDGGTSDPENLIVLCGAHHRAFHEGWLLIDGSWEAGFRFRHVTGKVYGSADAPSALREANDALQALRRLGYREDEARAALDEARRLLAEKNAALTVEALAEEAVRVAGRVKRYKLDRSRTAGAPSAREPGSAHVGSAVPGASPTAHVGSAAPDASPTAPAGSSRHAAPDATPMEEAERALRNLGFRAAEVKGLLDEARCALEIAGGEMTTERLLTTALRLSGQRKLGSAPAAGPGGASLAREPEMRYGTVTPPVPQTAHVGSNLTDAPAAPRPRSAHVGRRGPGALSGTRRSRRTPPSRPGAGSTRAPGASTGGARRLSLRGCSSGRSASPAPPSSRRARARACS